MALIRADQGLPKAIRYNFTEIDFCQYSVQTRQSLAVRSICRLQQPHTVGHEKRVNVFCSSCFLNRVVRMLHKFLPAHTTVV